MYNSEKLLEKKKRLLNKYAKLVEDVYNLRQTDSAQSDIAEFEATEILHKINKLSSYN